MAQKKVLVNVFHPCLDQSRGNRALLDAVSDLPGLTVRNLYAEYPDFHIDVKKEQDLLRAHAVVVMQHPLFWFGCPALAKEWVDKVLELGFAFPPGTGDQLKGKTWQTVITTGGSAHQYSREGSLECTMDEILVPFRLTATYCGMDWQPPFAVHGVVKEESPGYKRLSDVELAETANLYRELLLSYQS